MKIAPIFAVFFALIGYLLGTYGLNSPLIGGANALIYFMIALLMIVPPYLQYGTRLLRARAGYQFINNFIIGLSIHRNLRITLQTIQTQFSPELRQWSEQLSGSNTLDNLVHLGNYFNIELYASFIDLMTIYEQEGGDVIKASEILLTTVRRAEGELVRHDRLNGEKLLEFLVMWLMASAILFITRLSLGSMYFLMLASPVFIALVELFILLLIGASALIAHNIFGKNNAQGVKHESKMGKNHRRTWSKPQRD